jgi:hypothetical protein
MTLLFMEGFETGSDVTDYTARNLENNYLNGNYQCNSLAIPSRTGYPGKGLYLRGGNGSYSASANYPMAGANYPDFGMFQPNQSVYSLWQAGGFAVGFSAGFNAQNFIEIAPGESQQLAYDGAQYYWAIYRNGNSGAWGVCYSTDLQNWTITVAAAPGINQNSTITVNGSGLNATVIIGASGNISPPAAYYTNNMGLSWNILNAGSVSYRTPIYLNGATALFVTVVAVGNTLSCPAYGTTWTGTPTQLTSIALAPTAATIGGFCKSTGGYLIATSFSGGSSQFPPTAGATSGLAFCSASADPTVAGNWTNCPKLPFQIIDVAVFNGNIIAAGYGGIYTLSLASPTTWMPVQGITYGAWSAFSLAMSGTTIIATGQDCVNTQLGAIYTSTDGVHWTKINRYFNAYALNANTAFDAFTCSLWDGHQFIVTGGLNNGMIITSPDGYDWEVVYVTDYVESNPSTDSVMGFFTGTLSSANIWSPWNVAATAGYCTMFGLWCGAPGASGAPAGARQVEVVSVIANATVYGTSLSNGFVNIPAPTIPLGQQPGSSLTHYYEFVATAVAGTPNLFTLTWFIDGQQQVTPVGWASQVYLAAPADRGTTQVFLNLPRSGAFNVFDDIYLSNFAGTTNVGRLGPQNIFAITGKNVVQGQFSNTLGGTNVQTVNTELSNAEGYIYSATTNAEDIYSAQTTVPSNFLVKAVELDAYFGSQGQGKQVAGTVGIVSAGTAQNSAATVAGAGWQNRATLLTETDPKTGAAFTNAALNAVQLTVTKTT